MRVIAGIARGRRLRSPHGERVRPTADRVKEALFSMIASRIDIGGAALLDLFAGTGALGIEGLSRGAERAVFVEHDAAVRSVLNANLAACGFAAKALVLPRAVDRAIAELARHGERFDLVLMDPPYGHGLAAATLEMLAGAALVAPAGWVAVEHHLDDPLAPAYGPLRLTVARAYGKTALALFLNSRMAVEVTAT